MHYVIEVYFMGEWAMWARCSAPWRQLSWFEQKQDAAQTLKYWRARSSWKHRLRVYRDSTLM